VHADFPVHRASAEGYEDTKVGSEELPLVIDIADRKNLVASR
jgi:hypothetical protein